jgi:hypothetical protein
MYCKLGEHEKRRIERISDILGEQLDMVGDLILVDNLVGLLEDLLIEYDVQVKKYEEFEKNVKENYKFIGEKTYEYGE